MTVKPAMLIAYLRWEAVRQNVVEKEMIDSVHRIHLQFQRVRWHIASACMQGNKPSLNGQWDTLAETPIRADSDSSLPLNMSSGQSGFRKASDHYLNNPTQVKSCFTCNECSNACPVCFERPVFNPLLLFRLTNLGFPEAILASPSLWLCIGCESCTKACGQKVKGHLMIRRLQQMTQEQGFVNPTFPSQWQSAQEELYTLLLDRIDALRATLHK
jgi:Fe-S oxidoreductase